MAEARSAAANICAAHTNLYRHLEDEGYRNGDNLGLFYFSQGSERHIADIDIAVGSSMCPLRQALQRQQR
jgi:hypothetical protein